MASFSSNLLLSLLSTGESNANGFVNWGESANSNYEFLEDAVTEISAITVTTANVTLSAEQFRSAYLKFSGALTGNRNIIVAARKGWWFVYNGCSGNFTLTIKVSGQTGVVIPQGEYMIVFCDTTDVRELLGNVYRRSNAVGTVSEASGVPTGAIIEKGSGVLKEWTKYADGTFIYCQQRVDLNFVSAGRCQGTANWEDELGELPDTGYTVVATLVPLDATDPPNTVAANCAPAVGELLSPVVGNKTTTTCDVALFRILGGTDFTFGNFVNADVVVTGRWF